MNEQNEITATVGDLLDLLRKFPRSTKLLSVADKGEVTPVLSLQHAIIGGKLDNLCLVGWERELSGSIVGQVGDKRRSDWLPGSYLHSGHSLAARLYIERLDEEMNCPLDELHKLDASETAAIVFEQHLRQHKLIPASKVHPTFEVTAWDGMRNNYVSDYKDAGGVFRTDQWVRIVFDNNGTTDSFEILATRYP